MFKNYKAFKALCLARKDELHFDEHYLTLNGNTDELCMRIADGAWLFTSMQANTRYLFDFGLVERHLAWRFLKLLREEMTLENIALDTKIDRSFLSEEPTYGDIDPRLNLPGAQEAVREELKSIPGYNFIKTKEAETYIENPGLHAASLGDEDV